MITINLGENVKQIPIVGFGTWQLRGDDCYNAVKSALETGYRHIDTATVYGNEEEVGRAIADSGINRNELFITTKLTEADYDDVESAVKTSLEKLRTDYIDLYLIHWPEDDRINAYKQMEVLQEKGLLRSLGVSNFTEQHLEELMSQTTVKPVVNQVEFNPFLNQKELLRYCQDKQIALEAYCPLARADKLNDERLVSIAEKYEKSPAQIMLRWAVQQGIIVIPKSAHEERIKQNIDIFDFEISDEDMETIDNWDEGLRFCKNPYKIS